MTVDEIANAIETLSADEVSELQNKIGWTKVRPAPQESPETDDRYFEIMQDGFYITVHYKTSQLQQLLRGFLWHYQANDSEDILGGDIAIKQNFQVSLHDDQLKKLVSDNDFLIGDDTSLFAKKELNHTILIGETCFYDARQDVLISPPSSSTSAMEDEDEVGVELIVGIYIRETLAHKMRYALLQLIFECVYAHQGDIPAKVRRQIEELGSTINKNSLIFAQRSGRPDDSGWFSDRLEFQQALWAVFEGFQKEPSRQQVVIKLDRHPLSKPRKSDSHTSLKTLDNWLKDTGYKNLKEAWQAYGEQSKSGK